MLNKMKKRMSLLMAGTMMLSLAGVMPGYAENVEKKETVKTTAEEELDFSNFTINAISSRDVNGGTTKTLEKLMDMFAEEHPGFKYECEYITDRSSYLQKLKILAASDELPDWFDENPTPFAQTLVDAGLVVNIGDLLDEWGLRDVFFPVALTDASFADGSCYSIPLEGGTEYFWYNKDLFAQAGVEVPKTFDELFEVCEKLQDAGITPISIGNKDQWPILRYAAQLPFRRSGNDFIYGLKDGTAKMNSEIGIESANFVKDLAQYFNEGWVTAEYTTGVDLFVGKKAAIYYMGTWVLPSLVDENKELLPYIDCFTLPIIEGDTTTGEYDYWANSGIQTWVNAESMCLEMEEVIKYVIENFAEVALNEFDHIPAMIPEHAENLPQIYQRIISDLTNVGIAGQCWDVHLDPSTLEIVEKEIVNVALGTTTPEEYAEKVDESIANYLGQ